MTDYEKFQQWLNDCPVKILDYQDFSDQFQITFEVELKENYLENKLLKCFNCMNIGIVRVV